MAYLQETRLRPRTQSREGRADLEDAALGLVGTLWKNGQVWGDPLTAWVDGELHVVVKTPCGDSLNPEHHSAWVVDDLARLGERCLGPITWSPRGSQHGLRCSAADWATCDAFYLFTHAFDDSSPVNAGDDGEPAPLYLLPIDQRLRQDLVFWMAAYKHHDNIWLDSRELEKPAYAQLSRLDSELSRRGRELAADLERALGRPAYYYLQRYEALPEAEATRPCPGCGEPWAQVADSSGRGLTRFDFKCTACRLVSDQGVDVVDAVEA